MSSYRLAARNQKIIDSLQCEIQHKSGRERAELLLDVGAEYVDVDKDEAFAIIQCGLEEAVSSGDTLTIVSAMRMKGQVLYRMQRVDEAIQLFQSTLKISESHGFAKEEMMTSVSFAIILTFRSQYDKALQKLFRAKEIAMALDDTAKYQLMLNNIGVVYYKLKHYIRALYYWEDALRLQKLTENISLHLR
jgi:tetratricopeptide (TPR) repeat protein